MIFQYKRFHCPIIAFEASFLSLSWSSVGGYRHDEYQSATVIAMGSTPMVEIVIAFRNRQI